MKTIETYENMFFDFLLKGDRKSSSRLIKEALASDVSIYTVYEKVMRSALYKIGDLWENNTISVATEHLASAIVEAVLNEVYADFMLNEKSNKTVLVTCLENEQHQIGAKMLSDIFEMNNWNVFFLGSNVPSDALLHFAAQNPPSLFALSVSISIHLPNLEELLGKITSLYPDTPIIIGGQAFEQVEAKDLVKYKNTTYLSDLFSVSEYITNLNTTVGVK